jgi:DNA primase
MIKREVIDQVREQSDIVQVISDYLPLKKAGKYYKTLCPFHSEKSPSFHVSPERQIYHCFGCGAGGSVFTFLMQFEKLSYPESIKKLAAKLGITIEEDKTQYRYQSLYDACEFATNYFVNTLQQSKLALEYLKYRNISNDTIKRFRLGYAPSGNLLINTAKKQGVADEILLRAGLAVKKEDGYHDWFFNRITFPVFSISGKVVGFGARTLDSKSEPKYLNTPETQIFKKGQNLYGLFQAKNHLYQNIPILVEGNFDLLSLVDKGINNVIAPLGTAFTPDQALLLRRYSNQAIIAFDADPAGQAATLRTIETLLKVNLDPHILILPEGFDPDKYIQMYGKEKFNSVLKGTIDFIDFILQLKSSSSISDKRMRLKEILSLISLISENINQELYLNKATEVFKVSKEGLLNQIQKNNESPTLTSKAINTIRNTSSNSTENSILSLIISIPEYAMIAKEGIPAICFSSSESREIIQTVFDNLSSENFTAAKLIDITEKPELKKIIADLSFRIKTIPSKKEFQRKLKMIKASWYYKAMLAAKGDSDLLEKLSLEHYNLKKDLSKRSS